MNKKIVFVLVGFAIFIIGLGICIYANMELNSIANTIDSWQLATQRHPLLVNEFNGSFLIMGLGGLVIFASIIAYAIQHHVEDKVKALEKRVEELEKN
jgi:uncharacterized membrane protein